MAIEGGATGIAIKLGGQALSDPMTFALSSCEVRLCIYDTSRVLVVFEDKDHALIDDAPAIGDEFEVSLVGSANGAADGIAFWGHVTSVGVEQAYTDAFVRRLTVEARDLRYRFANASKFEAMLKTTVADIVGAIAKSHGLKAEVTTKAKLPYFLRHGSDHAVLTDLAATHGAEWWVDQKSLRFGPREGVGSAVALKSGEGVSALSVKYDAVHTPKSVVVQGRDRAGANPVAAHTSKVAGSLADLAAGADAAFVTDQVKAAIKAGGDMAMGTHGALSATEETALAKAEMRRRGAMGLRVDGTCWGNGKLLPGRMADIAGMGPPVDGKYYLTEVIHSISAAAPLSTQFVCGGAAGHREPLGPMPEVWGRQGPVVGVVTKIDKGLVTVRFPSLADKESAPARVVSIGGGPERGMDFMPEVNDEVLVVFEQGDVRHPLILGGMSNTKIKAPTGGDGKQRTIQSREKSALIFDDDKKKLLLHAVDDKSGLMIDQPNKKMVLTLPAGGVIELKAGKTVLTLSDQDGLKVTTNGKAIIDAKQDAQIGGLNVKVESKVNMDLKGGANVTVKAGAVGTVQAGAPLNLKGAIVKLN